MGPHRRRECREVETKANLLSEALTQNLTLGRVLSRMTQADVARGMYRLGHNWTGMTVSTVEAGNRRVDVDELGALALIFGWTIPALLTPPGLGVGAAPNFRYAADKPPLERERLRMWLQGSLAIVIEWVDKVGEEFELAMAPRTKNAAARLDLLKIVEEGEEP